MFPVVSYEAAKGQVDLPDEDPLIVLVGHGSHLSYQLVYLRPVLSVEPLLAEGGWISLTPHGVRRVVPEGLIFHEGGEDVDPESIHVSLEPEAHHVEHRPPHLRVAPVQIRLLPVEQVQVVLSRLHVPFPGGTAEVALPVVRRSPVRDCVAPDIPVALRVVAGGPRFDEPGMLV